jgi:prepilin-type N-terminal cleavage/methylation domain-containing protein
MQPNVQQLRDRRHQGGFTLVEVMIASVVFLVGMLTLSSMQLHSLQAANSGRHATQAAAIAETQLEQLQRLAWTQVTPTAGWAPSVTINNTIQAAASSNQQSYTLDWRISNVVANWTRSIDVRVRWDEPKRPNRSVVFSSMRYNREG